ncbi:MAG: stage IV sporulation protein A [Clostridia bacterium]|nr:stage IV sporulation protein A [Clostridia bacterium]
MTGNNIYKDIAARTGGDIYVGVVGPVRTGKSTFIKHFMDTLVIPNITDEHERARATDELPQSAGGKTVMTTEPKFIPNEAVNITLGDNVNMKVRMVDCVGYMVPGALGDLENGETRMVHTPWSAEPVPFAEAAETGTRKVICDHSTVGAVVTTDGTIGEIPRSAYVDAERRVISEMKAQNKPFVIILNSAAPDTPEAHALAMELEEKYASPVALVNCTELDAQDIRGILEILLSEFPVREIGVDLPRWVLGLDCDHWLRRELDDSVMECAEKVSRVSDIRSAFAEIEEKENVSGFMIEYVDLATGSARIAVEVPERLYYGVLEELTGVPISDEAELFSVMAELAKIKKKWDRVAPAIEEVNETGYGIIPPDPMELTFDEPKIVKQGSGCGVKLSASAPSIHMIRANIETELNPIVGSEARSEEMVNYLLSEFEGDPQKIWESEIFGKSLLDLVNEGLNTKLGNMPSDAREKLGETLERIINEGSGGLICILL